MLTYSRHLYNKVFFPRRKTVAVTSGELKVLSLRPSFHSNFEAFVLHVFYISLWHTRRTHPQPCPDSMGTRLATLQSVPSAPLGSPCPEAPHRAPAPSD